ECICHRAWSEITEKIDWAVCYITINAKKSQQRKSRKDITLDGVFSGLNA
ncbi:IS4 family transposase, partial [Shewanella sp. MF05960]